MLREAERVLREDGPEALSLREIARKAGVSEAAPYHHFKDRTALIAAVAHRGFTLLGAAFAREQDPDPCQRLAGIAEAYVRFAIAEPGKFRAMFGAHVVELGLDARPEVHDAGHPARELLLELCFEVAKVTGARLPAAHFAAIVWAQVHGIAWLHLEQEYPDLVKSDRAAVALARRSIEVLIDGLRRGARRR